MDLTKLAVAFCAMIAAAGVAYVFIYPYLSGEARAEARQKAIAGAGDKAAVGERLRNVNRREQIAANLKEMEARENNKLKLTLEARIEQAGLSWDKQRFYMISAIIGAAFAGLAFAGTFNPFIALGALFVGGLGVPRWLLAFLKKRRLSKFVSEFPNAIDVIVRGVKSGLPLGDCIRIISVEAAEPVKSEFRQIVEAQTIGLTIQEACSRLHQRVPITEANFFGIVIAIQSKTGGSLSDALGNLSKVLRERRKMKDKISAMSMEAKASAAIIGALPFIVAGLISVTSPGYMNLLFTTEAGKVALAASGVWMVIGLAVMKKMIAFDF